MLSEMDPEVWDPNRRRAFGRAGSSPGSPETFGLGTNARDLLPFTVFLKAVFGRPRLAKHCINIHICRPFSSEATPQVTR